MRCWARPTKRTLLVVGRPSTVTSPVRLHAHLFEGVPQLPPRRVAADGADDRDAHAQRRQVGRDVARAAEAGFLALEVQDRHRRLGREAVGVAVEVAVGHEVAQHHDAAAGEGLGDVEQAGGHGQGMVALPPAG